MPTHSPAILAIDASTEQCSTSLRYQGGQCSRTCSVPRSHAQKLLPMVDEVLCESGVALHDLSAIAVTLGPGSFTGVRICLSVAQGLAYGAGVPLIGGNSLEVMAYRLMREYEGSTDTIVSCLDARMNEVYWAAYRIEQGRLVEIKAPEVCSPECFNQEIEKLPSGGVAGGHGIDVDGVVKGSFKACLPHILPDAETLLDVWDEQSLTAAINDASSIAITELEPLYLRNEVAWEKRTRIRKPEHQE